MLATARGSTVSVFDKIWMWRVKIKNDQTVFWQIHCGQLGCFFRKLNKFLIGETKSNQPSCVVGP